MIFNGSPLDFDVPPSIEGGRVMVGFRKIFEALGLEVAWDPAARKVTGKREGLVLELFIGQKTAYKNGEPVELDVPAKIVKGRTEVPLRFVSEQSGAQVRWDGTTYTGYIESDPFDRLPGRIVFRDNFSSYPVGSVPPDPPWRFFDGDPVATNGTVSIEQDVEPSGLAGNVLRVDSDYGDGAELHVPAVWTVLPPGTPASEDWGDYHVRFRFRLANTIYGDGPAILLRKSGNNFYLLRAINDVGRTALYLEKVVGWDGYPVNLIHIEGTKGVRLGYRQLGTNLEAPGWHTLVASLAGGQITVWLDGQQVLSVADPDPVLAHGTIVLGAGGTSSVVHYDDVAIKLAE